MHFALLALAVFFAAQTGADQELTGTISGYVWDKCEEPVAGATLLIIELANTGDLTDWDGYYCVEGLPPGEYTIVARRVGDSTTVRPGIEVTSGSTATADFVLVPDLGHYGERTWIPYSPTPVRAVNVKIRSDSALSRFEEAELECSLVRRLAEEYDLFLLSVDEGEDEPEGLVVLEAELTTDGVVSDVRLLENNTSEMSLGRIARVALESIGVPEWVEIQAPLSVEVIFRPDVRP